MKVKNMILSAVLSAVLLTGAVGATTVTTDVVAVAATTAKLGAPKGIKISEKTSSSFKVSWKEVSGASGYRVYLYNAKNKTFEKYKDVLENYCVITDLSASKKYYFKIAPLVFVEQTKTGSYATTTAAKGTSSTTKTSRNIGTDKSIALNPDVKLPAEYGYYFSGSWKTKSRIDDYTYKVQKSYDGDYSLTVYLKGETTYWDGESNGYQYVQFILMDDEGYAVETKSAYRDASGLGKFKDMSVTFYGLKPGKYSFSLGDYGYGDKPKLEDEKADKLNGCTVDLPSVPQTISKYNYSNNITSSCSVTAISCEVEGDDLVIYFSGKKTYDSKGAGQSASCYIGWKLYEVSSEGDIVVADGTCYTLSLKKGELFKNASDKAYNCIEKGKHYRLEIMSVN